MNKLDIYYNVANDTIKNYNIKYKNYQNKEEKKRKTK